MSGDLFEGGDGSVTETSTVGWFARIIESIKGIAIGLVLIVGTVVGLFWNEGRAVTTSRSLNEGQSTVAPVPAHQVAAALEGRLVYVTGAVTTRAPLTDATFGVSVDAIRLVRKVEMYQWHEIKETKKEKSFGGSETTTTTYRYERKWADRPVDSSKFRNTAGHHNPAFRYRGQSQTAGDASLGAFRPGKETLAKIKPRDRLELDRSNVAALKGAGPIHLAGEHTIYLGADPDRSEVGDTRVSFTVVRNGAISLIGRQTGLDIQPYQTTAGDRLLLAEAGTVPPEAMFAAAHQANAIMTWLLRALCAVMMWVGFFLLLRPFVVLGDIVPLFGSLLEAGAGLAALLATLLVAPTTIAVAWLFYRPFMAVALLAAGVGAAWLIASRRSSAAVAPAPAPTSARAARPGASVSSPVQPRTGGSFLPAGHSPLRQPRNLGPRQT